MSQENTRVRAAERFLESLIAGEPDMTLVTEDFEYEQHFGSTEGLYVGEEGLRRWIGTFYEIWDQASVMFDSVKEGSDRISVVSRVLVRGGKTGIEVEIRTTGIWWFEADGRANRLDSFNEDDLAEAAFLAR
jgi:hypothetical protein